MTAPRQVTLAGKSLDRSRHVCAFFNSKDEEYRVLLPFIKEGFARGEKAFHIVKEDQHADHRDTLTRRVSRSPKRKAAGSSSCDAGKTRICATATSIRTACWR